MVTKCGIEHIRAPTYKYYLVPLCIGDTQKTALKGEVVTQYFFEVLD